MMLSDIADLLTHGGFGVCCLLLLLLPSVRLLITHHTTDETHRASPVYLLQPGAYITDTDPYGHRALLVASLLRQEVSWQFREPDMRRAAVMPPVELLYETFDRFTVDNNLFRRRATKDTLIVTANDCSALSVVADSGMVVALHQPKLYLVAILNAGTDYVYLFDPAVGRMLYTCGAFFDRWDGYFLANL
jgi:hypothetical protein